jgi:hypothetical protein
MDGDEARPRTEMGMKRDDVNDEMGSSGRFNERWVGGWGGRGGAAVIHCGWWWTGKDRCVDEVVAIVVVVVIEKYRARRERKGKVKRDRQIRRDGAKGDGWSDVLCKNS